MLIDRFMGYRQSLIKNRIVDQEDIDDYIHRYSYVKGIEKHILSNDIVEIMKILSTKELPEVLVCANDSNAFAVMSALTQMGMKVPDDVSVVGFDDTPLCEKAIPKITTIQVQKKLMGEVAVSKLVDRIHRKETVTMTQLLSVKIVERDSLK